MLGSNLSRILIFHSMDSTSRKLAAFTRQVMAGARAAGQDLVDSWWWIGNVGQWSWWKFATLDIQNPPVIPCEDRCLESLQPEPHEMFGGSNAYSQDIWMSRARNIWHFFPQNGETCRASEVVESWHGSWSERGMIIFRFKLQAVMSLFVIRLTRFLTFVCRYFLWEQEYIDR